MKKEFYEQETQAHYTTYQDWLNASLRAYHTQDHDQRLGQWLFNHLHFVRPDLTKVIHDDHPLVDNPLNPFNHNQRIGPFLKYVERHW